MIARSCGWIRWFVVVAWIGGGGANLRLAGAQEDVLPGTQKLVLTEPLDVVMVRGISEFAEQEIALSRDRREAHWKRDYSSPEAYEKSIAPNRERLRTYIGAVDERVKYASYYASLEFDPSRKRDFTIQCRQDVLVGVTVESLVTSGTPTAAVDPVDTEETSDILHTVIVIPDASHDPEVLTGMLPGLPPEQRLAARLEWELGISCTMPILMSRSDELSGNPNVRFTNQTHREFIYRGAFEMGRHVIGYEVQKILSLVDGIEADTKQMKANKEPIIVWGHGEGGLLAMHAAALDPRIDICIVSGYFQERENVWREPIYRNVWRQLAEFGDSDIASLIAPRQLIIEACAAPEVDGPSAPRQGRSGGAAPGAIRIPSIDSIKREFDRAKAHFDKLGVGEKIRLIKSGDGTGPAGAQETMTLVKKAFEIADRRLKKPIDWKDDEALRQRIAARQKRQFEELRRHTQRLMHLSDKVRDKYWAGADRSSLAKWEETQEAYRTKVYDELIGRIPYDLLPPNARTRKIIDEPTHVGYEVVLDVWEKQSGQPSAISSQPEGSDAQPSTLNPQRFPSVIAGGILLLPKDIKPGEKRPVVVCQHGLEGVPMDTITEDPKSSGYGPYKGFSSALVKRGFIVYAPQNPYRGHDNFRVIQRKSNPLGRSLFSYIIPQHQQTLNWLASMPFVNADRIAFYGLSYGGKTAVRVPPMLAGKSAKGQVPIAKVGASFDQPSAINHQPPSPGYCLSIASADFNEWVMKNASYEDRYSYIFTNEYEIFEWNMGHVANYAELSNLMTPRPFMVERGHDDGVAPDEWVAWEYAKVKRHYDKLGIGDRTELEVFNGPHTINGVGTYKFLHKHLNWPEP
jgi:cephalosporin-C deacetylase-like acetyl esterase